MVYIVATEVRVLQFPNTRHMVANRFGLFVNPCLQLKEPSTCQATKAFNRVSLYKVMDCIGRI